MERDEESPKNVKEIVSIFEISNDKISSTPDGNEKNSSQKVKQRRSSVKNEPQPVNSEKNKVAAIKESFEKSMKQKFVPKKILPSVTRSLADVKKDLSKSMEFSQPKIPCQNNLSPRNKTKNIAVLNRFNSTDNLTNFTDDVSKSIYPVPAPRQSITNERRHQSSSDLLLLLEPSTPTSMHNNEFLENILEVSGLSSSNNELNKSHTEGNITVTDDSYTVNGQGSCNGGDENRQKKSSDVIVSPTNPSTLYCCRLCHSEWNDIISSLVSEEEETFIGNMGSGEFYIPSGETDKILLNLSCDFDAILDVLTFQSEATQSASFVHKNSLKNISKAELASIGKHVVASLTASLDVINAEMSSLIVTDKEVFNKIFEIDLDLSNLKTKFDSLLQRIGNVINLLFLLNRMLQHKFKETSSSKKQNIQTKLENAKEIKRKLDLDCQRLLLKLENSIPTQYFKECLHILTIRLSLSLRKECISFKLKQIPKILDLLETYHV